MAWWGWILLILGIIIVGSIIFILPCILMEETFFVTDKRDNYSDKKNKIENYIKLIRNFEITRDKETLYQIMYKTKIYQRLLGKFGYIKNFNKFNKETKVKNFKVIVDAYKEIENLMNENPKSQLIGKYCSLMIKHLSSVITIYNDLIDQLNEINQNPIKEYVYYMERIIIFPITVLTYIFTRPFTIANGDFNIYDKLDINKGWQLGRFLLSLLSEIAGVVSLFALIF